MLLHRAPSEPWILEYADKIQLQMHVCSRVADKANTTWLKITTGTRLQIVIRLGKAKRVKAAHAPQPSDDILMVGHFL